MARLWKPTPRLTPDAWGRTRVYPPTSGVPGPRNPDLTPYMRDWVRAASASVCKRAIMVCGAQMGKTEGQLDLMGERLDTRPAPILYVGPSKEFNTDQFEPRFSEMLTQSASLRGKTVWGKKNKKTLKLVAGVRVRLAHAGSSTALKSDPAALAMVDEYDEMLANVRGQGDPLGLIEARGFTHADFVTAIASTPSKGAVDSEMDQASGLEFWKKSPPEDLESAIWRLWQEGTMHHWAWPCPECGEFFVPRLKLLWWPEDATPARAGREARLQCPCCKAKLHDDPETDLKAQMNARGLYVAPGQWIENGEVVGEPADTNDFSFWVSGLASPFVTWGERAQAMVEAELSNEPGARQTATNAHGGEVYAAGGGEIPEWKEILKQIRPHAEDRVPDEAVFLTAGIDVQKNSIPYVIRAWGARATSWLIKSGVIMGSTTDYETWDSLSDLLSERFDGLPVKVAFIDSGFRPGKPDTIPENMVYEFCRRHARFVFPTKGHDTQRVPIVRKKIEVLPAGGANKYGLELMHLDSDYFKSWVHERVRWPAGRPGGWYLHAGTGEDYARQIVSEARTRGPNNRPVWVRRSRDNHFLDCEAMATAAGFFLNAQRIRERTPQEAETEPLETPEAAAIEERVAAESVAVQTPEQRAIDPASATREKYARMAAQMRGNARKV